MTCTKARTQIIDLDAHEAPSPALAAHIAACPECRRVYEGLRNLETAARIPSATSVADATAIAGAIGAGATPGSPFTAKVMSAVRRSRPEPEGAKPIVSLRGWTAGGAILFASLVAVQFSPVVDWLRDAFGNVIDVALATILGVALTVYLLLLVGSNLTAVRRALRWLTR